MTQRKKFATFDLNRGFLSANMAINGNKSSTLNLSDAPTPTAIAPFFHLSERIASSAIKIALPTTTSVCPCTYVTKIVSGPTIHKVNTPIEDLSRIKTYAIK